ncbi:uncharacterized protein LOC132783557 [Drosophila nasuta]|uniref:Uncharacterized protein LOC117566005 n=1 Tax=Drosophila albomicans TaxID=7291 RepID=A0A6P8WCD0_DROAB|nr:uncharacterized protein LOC117566005 [Drosophila albomicans]XP_060644774.1 uncharacterized protein LOC132783557 [Drosophila nasuta]XP_060644775.1 uncharacterized protein LOC132783557 [Drosophila nasuta]
MGFRVVLFAVMGLGAMYMMHLLAQDWTRIRPIQGITNLAGQASNALNLQNLAGQIPQLAGQIPNLASQASAALNLQRGKRGTLQRKQHAVPGIDWKRILARDPFECLQSLICQLMSGAEAQSSEAELLMDFLESSLEMAPAKIGRAFSRGLALRGNSERCYDEYPFCLYSAKTMLRILRWFSETKSPPMDEE